MASKSHGVALACPLGDATDAGEAVARNGGNAIDAALTAAAVLTVGYPQNCALGGDLLALVREPDGRTTFVNASGPAPAAACADDLRRDHTQMPTIGPATVTVPGMVAGWQSLHSHGAALPWSKLMQPAVDAAADGVRVSAGFASALEHITPRILNDDAWRQIFAPTGKVLTAGQTLRQPALATTLDRIAEYGADDWYRGQLAAQVVIGLNDRDVPITVDDLASFKVVEEQPLSLHVGGWQVSTAPPNSQGFILLQLLGALDRTGVEGPLMQRASLESIARAFMHGSRQRVDLLADPAAMTVDVNDLLTDHALSDFMARALVNDGAAATTRRPTGDTAAVVAADDEGRSVSLIQSVYDSFGSQILEPSTGVVMHNRGACFSLDPGSPNVFAGGKRPAHTLTPVLVERGDVHAAVGTMGGEMQPQILTQVLSHLLTGHTPQESVAAPRWVVGVWDPEDGTDQLHYESDVDRATFEQISQWPGPRTLLSPSSGATGHSQVAMSSPPGLSAGTDPRADGG